MVAAWSQGMRRKRAGLDIAELATEHGARPLLDAGGPSADALRGQSGSGKSDALGAVLEQLLLETSLRTVVLDPNSGRPHRLASRGRGRRRCEPLPEGRRRPRRPPRRLGGLRNGFYVRFTDFEAEEQAAVMRLDPIGDGEEYGVLVDLVEQGLETAAVHKRDRRLSPAGLGPEAAAVGRPPPQPRHPPLADLVHGQRGSIQDLAGAGGRRGLVVDLGSLETPGEKAIAAESVLAALWRRRAERDPVLIVIDEAHNVCPREPADEVAALATERAAQIAAEGRNSASTCSSRPNGPSASTSWWSRSATTSSSCE